MSAQKLGFEKEEEARIALANYYGQPFIKKVLHFPNEFGPGFKQFDAVSADGSIVAEVKNVKWDQAQLSSIQSDLKYLGLLKGFEIKLMILTNLATYQQFKNRDDEMRNLRERGVKLVGPDSVIFGGQVAL